MRLVLALLLVIYCLPSAAQVQSPLQGFFNSIEAEELAAILEGESPLPGSGHVIGFNVFFFDGNDEPVSPDSGFIDVSVDEPGCAALSSPDDPDTPEDEFLLLLDQISVEVVDGMAVFFIHSGTIACTATITVSAFFTTDMGFFSVSAIFTLTVEGDTINSKVSGAYYDPARDGEGVTVIVQTIEGRPHVLFTWYAYREGRQLWLVGNADAEGTGVTLPVIETSGGEFGSLFDPSSVEILPWGEVYLEFPECGKLTLSYQEADGEAGIIDMVRIIGPDEGVCP